LACGGSSALPTARCFAPLRIVPTSGPRTYPTHPSLLKQSPTVAALPTGNALRARAFGERHAPSYLGRSAARLRRRARLPSPLTSHRRPAECGAKFTIEHASRRAIHRSLNRSPHARQYSPSAVPIARLEYVDCQSSERLFPSLIVNHRPPTRHQRPRTQCANAVGRADHGPQAADGKCNFASATRNAAGPMRSAALDRRQDRPQTAGPEPKADRPHAPANPARCSPLPRGAGLPGRPAPESPPRPSRGRGARCRRGVAARGRARRVPLRRR
jgi:hypothetical protein